MEKLVVTRHRGGSFESRSLQACPLQPGHASQGKEGNRNGVGVSLERGSERTAAPAQGCNRHNEGIPYRSGSEQRGRSATMPAQRKQTVLEPQGDHVWGTHQSLSQSRTIPFIEVDSQRQQAVHQELDRTRLAWSSCLRHEDHADSGMVGQNSTPGWNQAEDQECDVDDLFARGPLGVGRTQSSVRPRREPRPSRCFNRRSPKQPNLNPARGSCSRCRSSNTGAIADTRSDDGASRCSDGSPLLGVDRIEVEKCRVGDRNPSVRICIGRRRTEGNQKQEQPPTTGGVRTTSASSLAGKHAYRSDEDWIFASPHYHGKTPYTYQILFRRHIRPVIERISGIKSSKEEPIGWHTLRRSLATLLISNGENVKVAQSQLRHTTPKITLELYAQAVSADQQEAHKKVVQMVLPAGFSEKLKARSVTATA